jgi:hypothetical protein
LLAAILSKKGNRRRNALIAGGIGAGIGTLAGWGGTASAGVDYEAQGIPVTQSKSASMKSFEMLKLASEPASFHPFGDVAAPVAGGLAGGAALGIPAAVLGAIFGGKGNRMRKAKAWGLKGGLLGAGAGAIAGHAGKEHFLDTVGSQSLNMGNVPMIRGKALQQLTSKMSPVDAAKAAWNTGAKGGLTGVLNEVSNEEIADMLGGEARGALENIKLPLNPLRYLNPALLNDTLTGIDREVAPAINGQGTADVLEQRIRQGAGL